VHDAWTFLRTPELVPQGARVTVVGGGIVGMETADLLASRSCKVTVIEATGAMAAGMSRSNRREVLDRLSDAGVAVLLETQVLEASGALLRVGTANGARTHDIGEYLLIATGAQPNRSALAAVEASGAPFVTIGDACQPGDFMSCIRDAWMVGLAIDDYPWNSKTVQSRIAPA
jgi:dimethylglycine catabolism A